VLCQVVVLKDEPGASGATAGFRVAGGAARDAAGLAQTVRSRWSLLRNATGIMQRAVLMAGWSGLAPALLKRHFVRASKPPPASPSGPD
jgi:hypothetical protein